MLLEVPKELVPIILAVALWGLQLTVIWAINKGQQKTPHSTGYFMFSVPVQDLNYSVPPARSAECLANALSHNNSKDVHCSQFLGITTTNSGPTATADVQQGVLQAALNWTRLFNVTLECASLLPHTHCTALPMHCYMNFCNKFNINNPFPLTEDNLCHFVAFLAQISP